MTKYYGGDKYSYIDDNGEEIIITFRERKGDHMWYGYKGERRKMGVKKFYSLGLKPLKPVGNMGKPKPSVTKSEYKHRKNALYVFRDED